MGIRRILPIAGVLSIICIALLISGCCGFLTETQNKNAAIKSWNSWADAQRSFDAKATTTLTLIGDHINTYQSVSTESTPDYSIITGNLKTDITNFQNWDPYLSDLDSATQNFSSSSASLTGDSKTYADDILTNMRTYHTEMRKAQADYIAACNDILSYIDSAQRGPPDETMRQAANSKKDDANAAIESATAAADRAMDSMKRLQSS